MKLVRPASTDDIEPMIRVLHGGMNPAFPPERWRQLFSYDWLGDKPDYGRVAVLDGEIVGCVVAIYADRSFAGRMERVVNVSSWYLDKRGRGLGLGLELMDSVSSHPDWHYLIPTSSARTTGLLERVGYGVLDNAKFVWRHRPSPPVSRGGLSATTDEEEIAVRVTAEQRRILKDHRHLPVMPVLFTHDAGQTLILFSDNRKGEDERWFDVLYVSDPTFLARRGREAADLILKEDRSVMAGDSRFCETGEDGPPPEAERIPLTVARYVRSRAFGTGTIAPYHLDHIYSEVPLADLKLR